MDAALQFRQPIHQSRDFGTETVANRLVLDRTVLLHVVQERRCERVLVELEVCNGKCYFERMGDVGLAGFSRLARVAAGRELVRVTNDRKTVLGEVLGGALQYGIEIDHLSADIFRACLQAHPLCPVPVRTYPTTDAP